MLGAGTSVSAVETWVTHRPKSFITHHPDEVGTTELSYSEGDFLHFYMIYSKLYGGVRIVSMQPRIIEVYLTVPNNNFIDPKFTPAGEDFVTK